MLLYIIYIFLVYIYLREYEYFIVLGAIILYLHWFMRTLSTQILVKYW